MPGKHILAPLGLWINPAFPDRMVAGNTPPHYINHDQIDFNRLADVLEGEFQAPQQAIRIRVPDDTIDQVTVHMRMMGLRPGEIDCRDFGKILVEQTAATEARIIPVRSAWSSLHALNNRSHCPPPICLPFVAEGTVDDFLDWFHVAHLTLRVPLAQQPDQVFAGNPSPESCAGRLTKGLSEYVADTFGIPYEPTVLLNTMGEVPEIAQMMQGMFGGAQDNRFFGM